MRWSRAPSSSSSPRNGSGAACGASLNGSATQSVTPSMRASWPLGMTYWRPSLSHRSMTSMARPLPDSPFSRTYTVGQYVR